MTDMPRRFLTGTYTTGRDARGVYLCGLADDGAIDVLDVCACGDPSFVVLHPDRPLAYAVNERPAGEGGVSVIGLGDAALTLEATIASHGRLPCHLAVLPGATQLAVVHYGCGTVTVFDLDRDGAPITPQVWQHDGGTGRSRRQAHAHPHCVVAHGSRLYVTDLGADRIAVYERRRHWVECSTCAIHAGAGPRHLCLDGAAGIAWLSNELDNTVSRLALDADGGLREIDWTGSLPADFAGTSAISEIARHPSGRWLYVGNRGHDSIARFAIDARGGLAFVDAVPSRGRHPRHFAITPDGERLLVANRDSDSLSVYAIDQRDGSLEPLAEPSTAVPAPVCICWL